MMVDGGAPSMMVLFRPNKYTSIPTLDTKSQTPTLNTSKHLTVNEGMSDETLTTDKEKESANPDAKPLQSEVNHNHFALTKEVEKNKEVVYDNGMILVKIKKKNTAPIPEPIDVLPIPVQQNEWEVDASVALKPLKPKKQHKENDNYGLPNFPDEEELEKKKYHSIGEVAGWLGVNTSQIRFWENEFDVLNPRKTKRGERLFRVEDIKTLRLIYHLLRNKKFSLEGAKDYLKANKKKADADFELSRSLEKLKTFLLEMKNSLKN